MVLSASPRPVSNRPDLAVRQQHVGLEARTTRAVDNRPALDQQIAHVSSPMLCAAAIVLFDRFFGGMLLSANPLSSAKFRAARMPRIHGFRLARRVGPSPRDASARRLTMTRRAIGQRIARRSDLDPVASAPSTASGWRGPSSNRGACFFRAGFLSMTTLMSEADPDAMARSRAGRICSGRSTCSPWPPNASMTLS